MIPTQIWKSLNIKETILFVLMSSDGSGSKFFDPGWVGSANYGLGLNYKNFP